MQFQWLKQLSALLLVGLLSHQALAQLKAEESKLRDYEQQLDTLTQQQQRLETQLSAKQNELAGLQAPDSAEQEKLDEAKQLLAEAIAEQAEKPGDTSDAKVENARFKLALAERKFKKANSALFDLQEEVDTIRTELSKIGPDIEEMQSSISQQRKIVEQALAAQLSAAKQQQQQQAAAAAAEIARLKAELAAKEAAAKQREAALKAAAAKAAAEKREAELAAEQAEQALATSTAPAAIPATGALTQPTSPVITMPEAKPVPTAAAPAASPASKAAGPEIMQLTTAAEVKAEKQALIDRIEANKGGKKSLNRIINIKLLDNPDSKTETYTLRSLGNEQYRGIAEITPGNNLLIIGFNRWQEVVSSQPDSNRYMMIYDGSNADKPRLVYYHESLADD